MSQKIDVLSVLDSLIEYHDTSDSLKGRNCIAARAAVAELIEAGKQLLPRSLCLNNPSWPDSTEIPLTSTLGELRAFAAALARVGG